MKVLYYDCPTGISGDMNLGALIDLGVDPEYLKEELSKLGIDHSFELIIKETSKMGITGKKVNVKLNNKHSNNNHKHDHKHKHKHKHIHKHEGASEHSHGHSHEHHHHHHDKARDFSTIKALINASDLNDQVKELSIKMFRLIAKAEGKVHGKPMDSVHFHEVGAVDSIVDIVGGAICLDYLNVDDVISTPIELGGGFVNCAHGKIPVPAPATMEILKNVPIKKGLVDSETTTPTGAAILKSTASRFVKNLEFTVEKIGYGLGTKDFEVPNVLRVYLGTLEDKQLKNEQQIMIETNIDDMNSELYPYIEEQLLDQGALDVYKTPIIMKKGRPAVKISVLAIEKDLEKLTRVLFKESSTGGIRWYAVEKMMLERRFETIESQYGQVRVKSFYYDNKKLKSKAEYEDCKALAKKHNVSINSIYQSLKLEGVENES